MTKPHAAGLVAHWWLWDVPNDTVQLLLLLLLLLMCWYNSSNSSSSNTVGKMRQTVTGIRIAHLIRSRLMTLYICVSIDWLIDWYMATLFDLPPSLNGLSSCCCLNTVLCLHGKLAETTFGRNRTISYGGILDVIKFHSKYTKKSTKSCMSSSKSSESYSKLNNLLWATAS